MGVESSMLVFMGKHGERGSRSEQGKLPLSGVAPSTLVQAESRPEFGYVSLGIEAVDEAMRGGLVCGGMTLVASRARAGSTALMIGSALEALEQNLSVLYVTDRLKEDQLRGRFVVRKSKVNGYRFRAGLAGESDRAKLEEARAAIAWDRLQILSRRSVQFEELRRVCRKQSPALVVADYEPGRSEDGRRPGYRTLELGLEKLSELGHAIGAALAVRFVLPRGSCEPDRLELPGLGSITQLFDAALFIHRDGDSPEEGSEDSASHAEAQIIRVQRRDIRCRRVPLLFDQRFGGLSMLTES